MSLKAVPHILEAAAFALVTERCRLSYMHDIRGGLQPLSSAVELLIRAAMNPGENPALAARAAALSRRALLNHEKSLLQFVDQVTPQAEAASSVNAGEVLTDVLRFIGNDAASRSVSFRLAASPDVVVSVQAQRFRMLVLGLSITLTDVAAPGTVIGVMVGRADSNVSIEFRSNNIPSSARIDVDRLSTSVESASSLYDLVLAVAARWATENGGRLALATGSDSLNGDTVRLLFRTTGPREIPSAPST